MRPQAFECMMYFCVRKYSASMTNGTFRQSTVSIWPDSQGVIPDHPDLNHLLDVETITTTPEFHPANYSLRPPGADTVYKVDSRTMFLSKGWLSAIAGDLDNILDIGDLDDIESDASSSNDIPGIDMGQIFWEAQHTVVHGVSHQLGPSHALDRIADIVSASIRNRAAEPVTGVAYTAQTYVHARW